MPAARKRQSLRGIANGEETTLLAGATFAEMHLRPAALGMSDQLHLFSPSMMVM